MVAIVLAYGYSLPVVTISFVIAANIDYETIQHCDGTTTASPLTVNGEAL